MIQTEKTIFKSNILKIVGTLLYNRFQRNKYRSACFEVSK